MRSSLRRLPRLFLWDYERGSVAYDLLCVALILLIAFVPPAWLGDPMVVGP